MVRTAFIVFASILLLAEGRTRSASASDFVPRIYEAYKGATLHIEAHGKLFNGDNEFTTGSGFVITSDGLAVTNAHVVLFGPDNFKTFSLQVQVGSRAARSLDARIVKLDRQRDLALIKFDTAAAPIVPLKSVDIIPGQQIAVLGFPLKYELAVNAGRVTGPHPPRWVTDAAVNPGSSGGPVFNDDGFCIGIVSGAAVKAKVANFGDIAVEGIKFFTSMKDFFDGFGSLLPIVTIVNASAWLESSGLPPRIVRAYQISELKDDHPNVVPDRRSYVSSFRATEGYRIVSAELLPNSANHVSNKSTSISPDGSLVTVTFDLESGAFYDRWRGWFDATIATTQVLRER